MSIIKHTPSDFVVKEVYIPKNLPSEVGEQEYFLLKKKGFTTFESIEKIAASLGCEGIKISYAGLKDEDGITEQHVGIAREYAAEAAQDYVAENEDGDYIVLHRTFRFGPPIEIGKLIGNAFRVVVRKLRPELEETIENHRKAEFQFLNYYDTQRFGIPNAPKNTHLVGQQLVLGDYAQAFQQLLTSGTREAAKAEAWEEDPKAFFDSLDPRMCSFYYSAAASSTWNNDIMQAIDESDAIGKRETFRDGIRYVLSSDPVAVLAAQTSAKEKPMIRYARSESFAQTGTEERPAVIQTRFRLVDLGSDEHHPGYIQAAFEYFLPSGCYATMAMDQFVSHLEDTCTSSDHGTGRG